LKLLATGFENFAYFQVKHLNVTMPKLPMRMDSFLCVCLGEVKGDARPNQLITFARRLRERSPIKYRDLLSAALNQTCAFQLSGSVCDGWPLDT
jgi:hypothetical protein